MDVSNLSTMHKALFDPQHTTQKPLTFKLGMEALRRLRQDDHEFEAVLNYKNVLVQSGIHGKALSLKKPEARERAQQLKSTGCSSTGPRIDFQLTTSSRALDNLFWPPQAPHACGAETHTGNTPYT